MISDKRFNPKEQGVPNHLHKYWDGIRVCMPPAEIEKLPIARITNGEWLDLCARVEVVSLAEYAQSEKNPDGIKPTKYEVGHDGSYRYEVLERITDVKAICFK